ncbi:MAG: DUF805 domain-containing protein [Flavobacteriales bacterium]|nr:DUF805 domain-containing protein [Flavobacteriales bacterium]
MHLISSFLSRITRTDRLTYQRNVALLALAKMAVDLTTIVLLPGTDAALVALSWANPFTAIARLPLAVCLSTVGFFVGLVWNSVRRLRDTGLADWAALLTAIPFLNALATVVLALLPSKRRTVWDLV